MVHMCRMIIPLGISFFIFWNFGFLGCCKRTKNSPKWQKFLSVALIIWRTIHHITVIYVCKMIIFWCFFHFFFLILIFWVHREKTVQINKKLCLLCSVSQESYIIWLSFMVLMCKMIIFPGIFFSMLKFWFSRLSKGWKVKKWPKMLKISVCRTLYFRNHISDDLHLWYTCMCKKIVSPAIF